MSYMFTIIRLQSTSQYPSCQERPHILNWAGPVQALKAAFQQAASACSDFLTSLSGCGRFIPKCTDRELSIHAPSLDDDEYTISPLKCQIMILLVSISATYDSIIVLQY